MAVKLRLTRVGSKKNPIYRVVAADSRSPRDGKFIEIVGRYNPQTDPSLIELDEEKVRSWLQKGAQPTEPVARLRALGDRALWLRGNADRELSPTEEGLAPEDLIGWVRGRLSEEEIEFL